MQLKEVATVKSEELRSYHARAAALLRMFTIKQLVFCAQPDRGYAQLQKRVQEAISSEDTFGSTCDPSQDAQSLVQVQTLAGHWLHRSAIAPATH